LQSAGFTEEERRRYHYWHERDLRGILDEIRDKTPEIIITDTAPKYSWLKRELSAIEPGFLDRYEVIAEEHKVRILRLKASMRASPERPPTGSVRPLNQATLLP
jgi:hypothetical protein